VSSCKQHMLLVRGHKGDGFMRCCWLQRQPVLMQQRCY
jgi:hypothetical protein